MSRSFAERTKTYQLSVVCIKMALYCDFFLLQDDLVSHVTGSTAVNLISIRMFTYVYVRLRTFTYVYVRLRM